MISVHRLYLICMKADDQSTNSNLLNEAFLVRKGNKEAILKIKICSKFSRPPTECFDGEPDS